MYHLPGNSETFVESQNKFSDSSRFPVGEDIWYQFCRICATHNDNLIPIFEGKGLKYELAVKISKHLPFKVKIFLCLFFFTYKLL